MLHCNVKGGFIFSSENSKVVSVPATDEAISDASWQKEGASFYIVHYTSALPSSRGPATQLPFDKRLIQTKESIYM